MNKCVVAHLCDHVVNLVHTVLAVTHLLSVNLFTCVTLHTGVVLSSKQLSQLCFIRFF